MITTNRCSNGAAAKLIGVNSGLAAAEQPINAVRVKNARAYDAFYQSLISEVKIHNVTALLSMEEIKATTALPL